MYKITNKNGPNVTILLPGGCSAKCKFCFWNEGEAKIAPTLNYYDNVKKVLTALPYYFNCLSISGGEPTSSPCLGQVLTIIEAIQNRSQYSKRFDRVVLTTNGSLLFRHISKLSGIVDHVNISRHHYDDEENFKVFGTKRVPSTEKLTLMINAIHKETSADVCLNCVIDDSVDYNFIMAYLVFAKKVKADKVSFRRNANESKGIDATAVENALVALLGSVGQTDCPVCRSRVQKIGDMPVIWKGSVTEPSAMSNGVYEGVIHPDGRLYADWNMQQRIVIPQLPDDFSVAQSPSSWEGADNADDDEDVDNADDDEDVEEPMPTKAPKSKSKRQPNPIDDYERRGGCGGSGFGGCGRG